MSTIAASISPKKILELETSNLVYTALYWECRACAQIIFPKSGRGLASHSVQWGTLFSFGAQVAQRTSGRAKINGRNSMRDN